MWLSLMWNASTAGMLSTHSAVHIVNLHVISTPKPPVGKRELRVDVIYKIPALHTADHGHQHIYVHHIHMCSVQYNTVLYYMYRMCALCTRINVILPFG